jgi:two-component system, NtrC family, nitrogen regulation sensor histidine kinase NtrY
LITTLRKAVFKHGYLIITAAWLYTLSFIVANYWSYNSSPEKVRIKLEQRIAGLEKKIDAITNDTSLLQQLVSDSGTNAKQELTKEPFGLFVYQLNDRGNPLMTYWNSNAYYINEEDATKQDGSWFVQYQNGSFELLKKTLEVDKKKLQVFAIIPLYWKYFTETKYLHKGFAGFENLNEQYEISNANNAIVIKNINGVELFKLKQKEGKNNTSYDIITILLRTFFMIFLLLFINALAVEVVAIKGFKKGFSFLLVTVLLLRLITYVLPFPFNFSRLGLFDASIYASSIVHPSLGDLMINAILIFWLTSFYKFESTQLKITSNKRKWMVYINILLLVITAFLIADLVKSLVLDSKISFSVTNFFSLNVYSITSFGVLCLFVLFFFKFSHILLKPVIDSKMPILYQMGVMAAAGLVYLSIKVGTAGAVTYLAVLVWLLVYTWLINVRKQDMQLTIVKSSFFIFWVLFFAASVAALVMYQNSLVEMQQRKKEAEKIASQVDPSGESLLKIAITNFSDAFLTANYTRFQSEFSNKYIKDSLISENFSGYLNKYETKIYTFDSLFRPMYNDDSTSYPQIRTLIINQGKATSIDGLYSYESNISKFGYLYEKAIKVNNNTTGYLYVVVKSKRYKSEALVPELFNQEIDLPTDFNYNYAYAVYNNGKLINHFNDYPFASNLQREIVQPFDSKFIKNKHYTELWYNAGKGKMVVIAKTNNWFVEGVTLFAYLFLCFLIIISLFHAGNFLLQKRFRISGIKQMFNFNIRTQIHTTIIFISVFSFIVIGIATISFFIIRFNKTNQDRLAKTIQVMATDIESKVNTQLQLDDVLTVNDLVAGNNNEKKISEISEVHNVEVNVYDLNGKLIVSTQPYVYNKHLLSDKMQPTAFYHLRYNKSINYVQEEKVGSFTYLSIYVPLNDENGNTNAYLNIPYLNSEAELNQEISGFLATLINLNAFIFLLAGAIAFLVTNRITSSFALISDKMKKVNLSKVNEVIEWNSNDEIGALVTEYNTMVQKLEQSAKALAQNEREGAWREMARQVAHEIKNPLTPMKLSIQYLQKSIDNDSDNVKQLSQQVATTLVEQIDQLAKIAANFSQFANIDKVKLEKFDVSEVITSLINLHQSNNHLLITYNKPNEPNYIIADKMQMNRLFTNLLKNAVEASEEKEKTSITINQYLIDNQVQISITDNGIGIANEMLDKIFTPNFTTKSSGTGLGLAICKGIVEKANGSIWFETEENKGTTFFVQLPVEE